MRLDLYLEQILSYTFFYMNRLSELSVFFPAYNEEANLRMVVEKAINYLPKIAQKWEVLIVDDGSKDKTGEIADSLAKEYRQSTSGLLLQIAMVNLIFVILINSLKNKRRRVLI